MGCWQVVADICELLLVVMFAGLLCRVECVLVCVLGVFWLAVVVFWVGGLCMAG